MCRVFHAASFKRFAGIIVRVSAGTWGTGIPSESWPGVVLQPANIASKAKAAGNKMFIFRNLIDLVSLIPRPLLQLYAGDGDSGGTLTGKTKKRL